MKLSIGDRVMFVSGAFANVRGAVVATSGNKIRLHITNGTYLVIPENLSYLLVRISDQARFDLWYGDAPRF